MHSPRPNAHPMQRLCGMLNVHVSIRNEHIMWEFKQDLAIDRKLAFFLFMDGSIQGLSAKHRLSHSLTFCKHRLQKLPGSHSRRDSMMVRTQKSCLCYAESCFSPFPESTFTSLISTGTSSPVVTFKQSLQSRPAGGLAHHTIQGSHGGDTRKTLFKVGPGSVVSRRP